MAAFRTSLLIICCLLETPFVRAAEKAGPPVDFQRDIRPILSDKCFFCHGPDPQHRQAELRIDTREGLFKASGDQRLIVPGQPGASELWKRISHADPDQAMPPVDSGKTLTPRERTLLRSWIEQGAEWKEHWAYVPAVRPVIPAATSDTDSTGDIDRLIRARLQAVGLKPAPPGGPRTLIRRATFDLTGLPPTSEAVRDFVQQSERDPDAAWYALIERLLASPHFGERMAMSWLDLVRYADTVGYHGDQEHHISPYRDYVIEAFNDNLPFDQFTREQLAGDLLPEPTVEQQVATGYNRLLQTSHEGGVQQKEYLTKYASDRVRNFGSVWLGATFQCCECHDHKFDPLPQRDFYRLAAFFSDIDDVKSFKAGDTNPTRREPELEVTTRLVPDERRRTLITVAVAPRPVRVLGRGDWMDETGEVAEPGVPTIFKQLSLDRRATRLDLANWLTDRDNPLTARVFANRLWKHFFGTGLANRLDDFGAQGEAPVNAELLDWLAVEFMESGWNVKHLIRVILWSRTYRQGSFLPPAATADPGSPAIVASDLIVAGDSDRDPANRLLSRQSHWRLDAEMIRDNALAVSGLLTPRLGGKSVRPYQPDGYYQFLNFPKRNYTADQDDNQYRRAVYTHWQRAYLHPMLKAFDAPSREECTCERPQSITPQAALVLLNDPSFVEAARVFAGRILREAGNSTEARIQWAWDVALSRAATKREVEVVTRLLQAERDDCAANPQAAGQLLKTGLAPLPAGVDLIELAAWTSVARAIFNTNEFVTRN